ncbi:MAG: nucleotidyl transferase AbiEii/AbiGii toxin family protein [Limnochordia bacterium]|nr:nucleotidyl transferase AbiEii/AbiGii toxin family protein [Limnochordia bacterium]
MTDMDFHACSNLLDFSDIEVELVEAFEKRENNYSLRAHVLLPGERSIVTEHFSSDYQVKTLAVIEIFGSKINALLNRAAARDLCDMANMIRYGIFDESEEALLRKCILCSHFSQEY